MILYIVIAIDPDNGPYVWSDNTCKRVAECRVSECMHETGHNALVKSVKLNGIVL